MSQADLELLITQPGAQTLGLTLRFRQPAAGQDKAFSASWTLDEAALRQRQSDPTAYGECLAAQLLAGPGVRPFFDQALAVAASQRIPLHLRLFISSEAEALHALRWETLRLPDSSAPIAAGEWVRFSRYLDSAGWRPANVPQQGSLRALIAVASPDVTGTTLAEVRTADELAAARAGLADIPAAELATRGQVTLPNLLARLRDGCDILYLVAHGMLVEGEPYVLLEDERGGRAWTPGTELAARLGEMARLPSLVALVSCQSAGTGEAEPTGQDGGALAGLGPRLAAAGAPAVVAMQGNLTMTTAAAFMPVFLRELRRDGQVDRAMAVARGAVRERPDWWMPVLFTRLLDGRIWTPASPDALPEIPRQNFEPETVYIPEGSFQMGSDDPAALAWEGPPASVHLPAYRIGRRPVSHREFARFVGEEKRLAAAEWGWQGQKPPADPLSDPFLRLIGPDLAVLRSDYDSGGNRNALILATLPSNGRYFVSAEGLDGNATYTLRLFEPQPLPWNEPQASTGVSNTLWSFEGARSQVIDLEIAATGGAPMPQVTLRNANGDYLVESSATATGEARIPAYVLPAEDRYVVQVSSGSSLAPYTLTLASISAPALAFDQAVTATTQANPIWTFTGQTGQIVDIALNSARLTFNPELALHDAGGNLIAYDDDGGGDLNARIANFILPADGQYFVRPLPAGSPVLYTLALKTVAPQVITPGQSETSTLRENTLWAFDGRLGQPIAIEASTPTGVTPSLRVEGRAGDVLRGPESSPITAFFPPETGRYYLRVGDLNQTTRYTLALQEVQPPAIAFGETVSSNTVTNDLWRFSGQAGQVVTIDMTGWIRGGFDPYLTLLGSDGRTLIEHDDISVDNYNARIATYILPQSGDYFIRSGLPVRPATLDPYTLSLQAVQPPQIRFGETQSSSTQTIELWRFSGQAGQVVDIELTGNDFNPYLTLYTSQGRELAANDDMSAENYNARIAAFILPATGDYYIRAGQPGYTAPYRLSLTARRPMPAVLGSTVQTQDSAAYALPVQRPGFVAISVNPEAELSLAAPDGTVLASQAPAILARLNTTGVYTVTVSFPTGGRPRVVAMLPITAAPQRLDATRSNQGRLRPGSTDLWNLGGDGQAVQVTAAGETFTPLIELWAPGGERLAVGDENGALIGLLPAVGDALLSLRGRTLQASGPYTLTIEPIAAAPGPQACNGSSEASAYLPVRQGSLVVLGRQRPVNGDDGWNAGMTPYVGRQARVTTLVGADGMGCPMVQVDVDQGQYLWRARDMLVLE